MKKLLAVLIFGISFALVTKQNASAQSYNKGDVIINAGLGFPSGVTIFDVNGEYMASENVGVGALIKFITESGAQPLIGVQGNYHLNGPLKINNKQIDPYAGLSVSKVTASGAPIALGGQFGFRYLFQEKFGLGAGYNLYFSSSYSGFNHFGIFFTYKISN